MQDKNRRSIDPILDQYCISIHTQTDTESQLDLLRKNARFCKQILGSVHSLPDKTLAGSLLKPSLDNYTEPEKTTIFNYINSHYTAFNLLAPASLDARLEYNPASFNPARSLLSALAHADWWHLAGNLIFFFAFAPAIELIIGNRLKFILVLILIEFSCDITYTIVTLSSGLPVPSLGLSGVVTGMIGMAGYLMPKANIRTLFWFLIYVRIFAIPVWILALWYIGWDTYYLFTRTSSGGVNLVAHVSGGITGYLIGLIWFRERKMDISAELDDEIEYARTKRSDKHSAISTYTGDNARINNELRSREASKQYSDYTSQVYQYMRTGRDSDAIILFLHNYDLHSMDATLYEELFNETRHGRPGRSLLCLGKLTIDLLVQQRCFARAMNIAQQCFNINKDFTLSDPVKLIPFTHKAIELENYELAYRLIQNSRQRYGQYVNTILCQILEAQILLRYLNQPEQARLLVSSLLKLEPNDFSQEIFSLAAELNTMTSSSS